MLGFKKDSLILMGDYSYKKIQDIQVNEWVISYDENEHEFVKQIVVDTFSGICDNTIKYTFSDGTVIEGCDHTKFLTPSGYIEEIDIGQTVITLEGIATLISKESMGSQEVYDLDIEDIDNFLVYNVVVHNPPVLAIVTHQVYKDTTGTYSNTVYIWSRASTSASWAYKGVFSTSYLTISSLGTSCIIGFSSSSTTFTPISNIEVSLSSDYIPQPSYTYNADGSVTISSNLTTTTHTETHLIKINAVSADLPIYSGSIQIKKAYVGSTEIKAMYVGSTKIF